VQRHQRAWGWIIKIAAIDLIASLVIAGISHGTNTASSNPLATTGSGLKAAVGAGH